MAQNKSNLKRNIGIVVGLIIVLIVAVIAGIYLMGGSIIVNPEKPLDFQMSISSTSGTVLQGSNKSISVSLTYLSGKHDNVALSGDASSSGIQFIFNPATSSPGFTSTLTMNVPASTPTKVYSLVLTANCGSVTRTAAYTMSVLSAKVTVSGTVTTTGFGTSPTQIQFTDAQTSVTYTGTMSGHTYSISLQNQHTYNVVLYWQGLLGSSGTVHRDGLNVNAPVGSNTMTQDYTI